ncbi:MAG: DUF4339 domain-containing protein, partial [Victivallales bacterium]|nr:DUF4339 domain-containing protein [Victivallales bacterium]
MSSQDWFFKINNIEVGPIDSGALRDYALEGRVVADTPVRLGEDGEWTLASMVDGLFGKAAEAGGGVPSGSSPPGGGREDPVFKFQVQLVVSLFSCGEAALKCALSI